jgi:invasion protein IalB
MMIGSRDRWNSLSRAAARWLLGSGAAALALALAAPLTVAQEGQVQPKSTQAPKTIPAAPAPAAAPPQAAAPGAPAGAQIAGATEDAWVKLCMKSEQTQNKEICLINHEGLEPNSGMVLIAAAVRKVEGEDKQQLLIRVPTAYALVIPPGVQIKIDENEPIKLQYTLCFPTSCQVQMELTKEMMDSMRKGKQMVVAAMNIQQKTMGFPVPLGGFSKAYDGPPVDNKKYEESRRQLMEVFRKRQAELAAKAAQAEQQKKATGQPGAAPVQGATGSVPAPGAQAPLPQNATTAQQKKPAAPPVE